MYISSSLLVCVGKEQVQNIEIVLCFSSKRLKTIRIWQLAQAPQCMGHFTNVTQVVVTYSVEHGINM